MKKETKDKLTAHQALERLEARGSGNDPVAWARRHTDACAVVHEHDIETLAKDIRLTYWGGWPLRKIRGTLSGMVRDRERL